MRYEVSKKDFTATDKGENYSLRMGSRETDYQCSILAVTAEQFAAVKIGDSVEIAITVIPAAAGIEVK